MHILQAVELETRLVNLDLELFDIQSFVFQRSAHGENGYIDLNQRVDISAPALVELLVTSQQVLSLWRYSEI